MKEENKKHQIAYFSRVSNEIFICNGSGMSDFEIAKVS